MHLYGVASAAAGALLGSLIPASITGLHFALTALFAVLAVDARPRHRRPSSDAVTHHVVMI
jgi:predicted branched-subunit amino acid permease